MGNHSGEILIGLGSCQKCGSRTWLYDIEGRSWCDTCIGTDKPVVTTLKGAEQGVFPQLGTEQLKSTFRHNRLAVAFLINKYLRYCEVRELNPLKGSHCDEMKQSLTYLIFNIYISQTILNLRANGTALDDLE